MAVYTSHLTPLDGTPMHLWDDEILHWSACYWEHKVQWPAAHSTLAEQRFYKEAAENARAELHRRKVTEILLK